MTVSLDAKAAVGDPKEVPARASEDRSLLTMHGRLGTQAGEGSNAMHGIRLWSLGRLHKDCPPLSDYRPVASEHGSLTSSGTAAGNFDASGGHASHDLSPARRDPPISMPLRPRLLPQFDVHRRSRLVRALVRGAHRLGPGIWPGLSGLLHDATAEIRASWLVAVFNGRQNSGAGDQPWHPATTQRSGMLSDN